MVGITKRFPGVLANDDVSLEVEAGVVHALLGENGAGKTTLMNILYGLYQPDAGQTYIRGKRVHTGSPQDAIEHGIGMVHQSFKLIRPFSIVENVILGTDLSKAVRLSGRLKADVASRISELSARYQLKVADPHAKVWQLCVGEQQRVELLKALYYGADLLILDEPTSVLTPQEAAELFTILRSLASEGKSVILITHKLNEVMAVTDRVTVMRRGRVVDTVKTAATNRGELARMMIGRDVSNPIRNSAIEPGPVCLETRQLEVMSSKGLPAVKSISLCVCCSEILGIAGVDGNGQGEFVEAIMGLRKTSAGTVAVNGKDVTHASPSEVIREGVAYVPAERDLDGVFLDLSLHENIAAAVLGDFPFSRHGVLNVRALRDYSRRLFDEYHIDGRGIDMKARQLSGGNLQKLILARELSRTPSLLVAFQPTRGLDVGATEFVHRKLLEARDRGVAVLLVSTELDEVLKLSDRVAVIYEGAIVGLRRNADLDIKEIGLMMAGMPVHQVKRELPEKAVREGNLA